MYRFLYNVTLVAVLKLIFTLPVFFVAIITNRVLPFVSVSWLNAVTDMRFLPGRAYVVTVSPANGQSSPSVTSSLSFYSSLKVFDDTSIHSASHTG